MTEVVLIPGDGIGLETADSVKRVLEAAGAELTWVEAQAGLSAFEETGELLPDHTVQVLTSHRTALLGPLVTPKGKGFKPVSVRIRKILDLYGNIRFAKTVPGLLDKAGRVDMVLFRENTQGLYSGVEQWTDDEMNRAESVAVVTREASEKIVQAAFEYARKQGRNKVTLVHKANLLRLSSGLFLKVGHEMAPRYPEITFEETKVDTAAMRMVLQPEDFDVVVTTNLFGDILADLAAGLVGGPGMTCSASIGAHHAVFESANEAALERAGKGLANPASMLLAAVTMLDHLAMKDVADRVRTALTTALQNEFARTPDLGGKGNTRIFTQTVIEALP